MDLLTHDSESIESVLRLYAIPSKFFYVPNGFGQHKNHRCIIEALQILKQDGHELRFVSTGLQDEPRNLNYYPQFHSFLKTSGVDHLFQMLGVVPYGHAMALMRQCIAVVSSSKFEGFALSIAEAKFMGKAIVLSDIPVFREQAPERGYFFDLDNPKEFAEKLLRAYRDYTQEIDQDQYAMACKNRHAAIQAYARSYEDVVLATAARARAKERRHRVT
ncbi:hypothetical protein DSM21852_31090 [Methylocystis bryophila]|uniref:Glycosyl transferase family 1 domain-containing protein n=2 Tax=Methylocystis bryophila TaxID=655015 RepID=A0A1W6MQT0_9HYPH|nr:hypothetical protein B1812_01425 [Methylocystis bryophila]BDV39856.1 hypothetical protein DSM21852_31090 [Methylocystis bryophila]